MTNKLQKSVPPEILFIERCLQLLKENGRMAIVLPDAILGAPGLQYLRHWILANAQVLASIDLDKDTFQPKNGTQTSILFLRKKTPEEIKLENQTGKTIKRPVFMAIAQNIGHDKRGNIIYKRDSEGNETVVLRKDTVKDEVRGRIVEREIEVQEKIVNDETPDIANLFDEWKKEKKSVFPLFNF